MSVSQKRRLTEGLTEEALLDLKGLGEAKHIQIIRAAEHSCRDKKPLTYSGEMCDLIQLRNKIKGVICQQNPEGVRQ